MQERDTHDGESFIHVADLHLAIRSGSILKRDASTGRLERDMDMDRAFVASVDRTLKLSPLPSAYVIAGDIFDTYAGSPDAFVTVVREVRRLTDAGIAVIAIAGNHDTPTNALKTPMFCMLQSVFSDNDLVTLAYDGIERVTVGDIEYVLLPHKVCLDGGFDADDIRPSGDASHSVLVVHGVAAGDPSLRQMDEAKEIPIAKWILDLPWDYVAFGHYHKPGWIPGYTGKAAYSGSLENTVVSGPDVCMERGPALIDMRHAGTTDVSTQLRNPIRDIVRLHDISLGELDESEMPSATDLDGVIEDAVSSNQRHDAIVLLSVTGVPRSTYRALPRRNWQSCDPTALLVRVSFDFATERRVMDEAVVDDADDSDVQDNGQADDNATIRPLAVEAEDAVNRLVGGGSISAKYKDRVIGKLRELLAE